MKFFITSLFFLFTFLCFSQENIQHTVRKGESLYSISKKYKVSVSDLEELNPSAKKGLAINSILQISAKKENEIIEKEHVVLAKETLYGLSKKYNISIEKLKQLNPIIELEGLKIGQVLQLSKAKNTSIFEEVVVEKPKLKKDKNLKEEELQEITHVVLPKETKYRISKKYKISITELERLNPQIKNELPAGTRLLIRTSEKEQNEVTVEEIVPKEIKMMTAEDLSKVESVISTASSNIGTRYRTGGTDSAGFDCSGLMFSSFKTIDVTLPRTSSEQASVGVKIDKNLAQKGDLIFFATGGSSRINHVGLITEVSESDIKFVHSSTSLGVIISSITEDYYNKRFVQINRVISQ